MSSSAAIDGAPDIHLESTNESAAPKRICNICHQNVVGKRCRCDSCHATACQVCAKTEWHWKESENNVRHKCAECKKKTMTSSIVQQCLDRAESAAETDPGLSAALYNIILPWLSKEQKTALQQKSSIWQTQGNSRSTSLEAVFRMLDRRAQDRFDNGHYDKALEIWRALFELRPDDDHTCTMMVKAQVSCNDLERNESSQVERALGYIRTKVKDALEADSSDIAIALCDLGLHLNPNDMEIRKKLGEAELKRSEQLERFQPSPVAAIKASLQQELEAARDQNDSKRESSLMKVLEATLIQEHRHYQNLGRRQQH